MKILEIRASDLTYVEGRKLADWLEDRQIHDVRKIERAENGVLLVSSLIRGDDGRFEVNPKSGEAKIAETKILSKDAASCPIPRRLL